MSKNRKPNPRIVPVVMLVVSVAASAVYTDRHYQLMVSDNNLTVLLIATILVAGLRYAIVGDLRDTSNYPRQDMFFAILAALVLGGVVIYNRSEVMLASLLIVTINWSLARWLIRGPRQVSPTKERQPATVA